MGFEKVLSFSFLTEFNNWTFLLILSTRKTTLQALDPEQDTKKATPLPNMVLCRILECYRQWYETVLQ